MLLVSVSHAQQGRSSLARPVGGSSNPPAQLQLTAKEREYLKRIGPITVCPDPDWLPYSSVDEKGNFTGIAADLLHLLAKRLDIQFRYIAVDTWDQAIALSQSGRVMLLPFLNQTPKRDKWLLFTDPLFIDPNVFITRAEHLFITDASLLRKEVVAVPSGTSIEEKLRRDFPNLTLLNTGSSEAEVFKAIAEHRADLTLRSLTVAAYTIRKGGWFSLKIAGQAPDEYLNRLRIGVLRSEPMLRDILNKGIATITPQEREEISTRHVNITVVKPFDYGLIIRITSVLALLVGLSFYWNLRLKRINAALAESEQNKTVLLEKLEQSLADEQDARAEQGRFIDMVSHEFRTPLAVIQTNMEILGLPQLAESQRDASLGKMDQGVRRLRDLFDNYLHQSELKRRFLLSLSPVDMRELLEQCCLEARCMWGEGRFQLDVADMVPPLMISGDRALIQTAVSNLLDNAGKYADSGSLVGIVLQPEAGGLLVQVENSLSPSAHIEPDKLFEKYYRGGK